jgi:hypothetical protein
MSRQTSLVAMTLVLACGGTNDALHGRIRASSSDFTLARGTEPVSREQLGMLRLMFDDLGGLRVANDRGSALPWKVLVAALVIDRSSRRGTPATMEEARAAFSEVGFLFADSIANSPQWQPARADNHPIGIVTGTAEYRFPRLRLEIANITCGSCHVGVVYDSTGLKTHAAWAGMPNTSIDVGAFSRAVYRGLKLFYGQRELALVTIDSLFPTIDSRERHTIDKYVLPAVERRVKEMAAGIDAPIPFNPGGPGQANSIAAMRYQLGMMSSDTMSRTAAYSSIPDFANRQMRNVLLYDGGRHAFHTRLSSGAIPRPHRSDASRRRRSDLRVALRGLSRDDVTRRRSSAPPQPSQPTRSGIGDRYRWSSRRRGGFVDRRNVARRLRASRHDRFDRRLHRAAAHRHLVDGAVPPQRLRSDALALDAP